MVRRAHHERKVLTLLFYPTLLSVSETPFPLQIFYNYAESLVNVDYFFFNRRIKSWNALFLSWPLVA
jgi:hypothetical protein